MNKSTKKKVPHAYQEYEDTCLWKAIEDQVAFLKRNQDLTIETEQEYIVGSLCKAIAIENKRWLLRKGSTQNNS